MQVVENLTELTGRILARQPHPSLDGFDVVTMRVEEARPVPGYRDLLSARVPGDLDVVVRRELLGDAGAGALLRCRAALTSQAEVMAQPHPAAEDFSLLPPPDA
jgi:hypothetical protein